jgi:hypothetical protein
MFYKVILLLGQFVKEITCRSVWNVSLEKALVFVFAIVGKYSIQEPISVSLFDSAVFYSTAFIY